MTTTIRKADPDDAAMVANLAKQTFIETFGHLYPPEDLEEYLLAAYDIEDQRSKLRDSDYAVFLAEEEGIAVGFVTVGLCGLHHPDIKKEDGEVKRLYVLKSHQNGGRGKLLYDAGLAWLLTNGPRPIWLGVWSENYGAQRFYKRRGFSPVGTYEFPVGKTRDLEFIMRLQ
eukprot:Blabericola_migrator_1__2311@NODE_1642_length_4108_cov_92_265281_g1069_i0_p3_GENE_NODE_1642_length_4108_cov_92_265281_g1069_i0NODE_1642_length_4108_cov_92_265281_g1069_i0_p3_ORF_typecomplete_len171_score26_92Acetyltransf_1/PF00583_25/5_5e18Acetyltransf_10/PF13673_7/1_7e16Acetyltransf_4/PF13420_7/1_5e11Acetyltransf_7/PF13508_7/4e09FR47/PF08445_10/5_6e09Acetyltransf_3/PF13302_7/5_8e09Acetyltransf_9/PF13527_7/2_3e05GNAT_acetyltran/PF12746_7/0_004Acetyltransf_8/PF13523_6/0_17Acetyltransf_16/PF05301_